MAQKAGCILLLLCVSLPDAELVVYELPEFVELVSNQTTSILHNRWLDEKPQISNLSRLLLSSRKEITTFSNEIEAMGSKLDSIKVDTKDLSESLTKLEGIQDCVFESCKKMIKNCFKMSDDTIREETRKIVHIDGNLSEGITTLENMINVSENAYDEMEKKLSELLKITDLLNTTFNNFQDQDFHLIFEQEEHRAIVKNETYHNYVNEVKDSINDRNERSKRANSQELLANRMRRAEEVDCDTLEKAWTAICAGQLEECGNETEIKSTVHTMNDIRINSVKDNLNQTMGNFTGLKGEENTRLCKEVGKIKDFLANHTWVLRFGFTDKRHPNISLQEIKYDPKNFTVGGNSLQYSGVTVTLGGILHLNELTLTQPVNVHYYHELANVIADQIKQDLDWVDDDFEQLKHDTNSVIDRLC